MRELPITPCFALVLGLLLAGGGLAAPAGASEADGTEEPSEGTCVAAGPQSPRDIDQRAGENPVTFAKAPPFPEMRLCDIHFHKFAEHRASGYPDRAGEGQHAGFACAGTEPEHAEEERAGGCRHVALGDSIETHWVFTTCDVEPGPGLGSCFNPVCANPQIRVEAQVFYLTAGDEGELDFRALADGAGEELPPADGAVEYLGSTTGPSFSNRKCSPMQLTWNVRPDCLPLSLASLDAWCDDNVFGEDHAHGVRELVTPPELLSPIE